MFDFLEALSPRLRRQVEFLVVADGLKRVERRTAIAGGLRRENSAEHSWHAALAAMVLAEHAQLGAKLDLCKVLRMLLVHDLVEIEAGDTFVYHEELDEQKRQAEKLAADNLFGQLPPDQAATFRQLWEEFEQRQTPEAQFAAAVDRILPILLNFVNEGRLWQDHGIREEQVRRRNEHIWQGGETLGQLAWAMIDEAVRRGFLAGDGYPS